MRVWPIMIWHLDDKASEVMLCVKDLAMTEGDTSSIGKTKGIELCVLLPVRTRKELNQRLSGAQAKSGLQLGFGLCFIGSLTLLLRLGGGRRGHANFQCPSKESE